MPRIWNAIQERLQAYTSLPFFEGAQFFLEDILSCLRKGEFRALAHPSSIADGTFARWYTTYGHHFACQEESLPIPALVHSAHGIVLELGACTGNQLPRLDKNKITQVYGIEPNKGFEPALTRRIAEHGLSTLYTPVWTRFENAGPELERLGVKPGTVDCVISVQVLCSTNDPAESVRECWRWLKPGGELLFCEHGANKDWITRVAQRFWDLFWPSLMGGCRLTHPMEECLMAAEWEIVEMESNDEWKLLFPRVSGRFRKPLKPSKVF